MKQTLILFLSFTFAGSLTIGCGGNNTGSKDSPKNNAGTLDMTALKIIIDEKNNRFTQAHITGDTAFLNNIFTQDAKVFAPNTDVVIGRSAIAAVNMEFIHYGIKEFREETTDLYGNEEYLINEGRYSMIYGKENTNEKGKFINIWKKVDGDWKIQSNIWNTNTPDVPAK